MTCSSRECQSFQYWVDMITQGAFDLNRFCWTEAAWEYIMTPPSWVIDIIDFKDQLEQVFVSKQMA